MTLTKVTLTKIEEGNGSNNRQKIAVSTLIEKYLHNPSTPTNDTRTAI